MNVCGEQEMKGRTVDVWKDQEVMGEGREGCECVWGTRDDRGWLSMCGRSKR